MRYQEPDFLPWDGRRVPLTFVAGYLGAGKTTLINEVLAVTDRPVAVFVNDVGEVNVDARLIRKRTGETIELNDGCVCCSLVDGFGAAFDQLRARDTPPDHLIVELSGVADPARVLPWGRTAGFRLDGVLTLAAADQIVDLTTRPDFGDLISAQLRTADLIALTKLDLVDPDDAASIEAHVREIAGDAPIVDAADHATTTPLLRIGGRRPGGAGDVPEATLFDRHTVDRRPLPDPIDLTQLEEILDALPDSVMRAKAVVVDPDGRRWAAHVVGRRRSIDPLPEIEGLEPTDLVTISVGT